jgi:4-hydroxybenzoate polyprenyltransferase
MYGIVALQNDMSDSETDKINRRKDIPYASGRLTESHLLHTILALAFVVTITGLLVGYQILPWIGLYILLGFLYSGPVNIKSRGIYAALLLGFCYGALPWLMAASITEQLGNIPLLLAACISFVFSSGIIVIKDFKDEAGDRATHKRTLLVTKGAVYVRRYYLITTSLGYALLIIYSYLMSTSLVLVALIGLIALLNYWLLASRLIPTNPRARSTRGTWARVIFFLTILVTYALSSTPALS